MNKYIKTINQKEITIRKNKVNYPFITSILEYFNFDINKIYFNESSSKEPNKKILMTINLTFMKMLILIRKHFLIIISQNKVKNKYNLSLF